MCITAAKNWTASDFKTQLIVHFESQMTTWKILEKPTISHVDGASENILKMPWKTP